MSQTEQPMSVEPLSSRARTALSGSSAPQAQVMVKLSRRSTPCSRRCSSTTTTKSSRVGSEAASSK